MWNIILHQSGKIQGSYVTRTGAKASLDDLVNEITNNEVYVSYVDYPNMSDIIIHTSRDTVEKVIGVIVYSKET